MEIQGICSICGKPARMHTCLLCGALVCSDCYDSERGVCLLCKKNIRKARKPI